MYISKELVANKELSELDLELKDEFKFDWDNDEDWIEIDVIKNKKLRTGHYADTTEISVNKLEKLIANFKKKGATHIQMFHHGDHHGYQFSGFKITLANDRLIEDYDAELLLKNELHNEYTKHQLVMSEIRSKIDNLRV